MENHDFIVPDMNFVFPEASVGAIKTEEVKNEDILLFSQLDQLTNNLNGNSNFQIIQDIEQAGPSFPLPTSFSEDGNTSDVIPENFDNKLPVDLSGLCKVEGIKNETNTPHYVKYKLQDGKHVKIWECGICGKEFGHQYTLMRHLPTHTDERKFQCNTCGKAFRQMSTLSQHRAIHSSERPYVCEICQKTFNRVSTLISHRKTHTGLKPHRCHLCNKAFHQKGNLRNHIFTHTNERPYKCNICEKGFNQMSNLMCHKLKAHQRADKPKYTCQICGRDFPKRTGLRNHEQCQHGLNKEVNMPNQPPTEINGYENGVIVDPIKTEAMRLAIEANQTPFALLRPLTGIPVLVRVLPAGNKQMLVPASADDLKKYGQISITAAGREEVNRGESHIVKHEKPDGSTVQIKIPVVATVIQQSGQGGHVSTSVVSPGPKREFVESETMRDTYVFSANLEDEAGSVDVDEESYEPNYITSQMVEDAQIEFISEQNKNFEDTPEFIYEGNACFQDVDKSKNNDVSVTSSAVDDDMPFILI